MKLTDSKPLLSEEQYKDISIKDHNALFTSLTPFLQKIFQQTTQIQQDDILPFTTQNTFPPNIVQKVEDLKLQGKNNKVVNIFFKITTKTYYIGGLLLFLSSILSCVGIFFLDQVTNKLKNAKDENTLEIIGLLLCMILVFFLKSYLASKQNWYNIIWRAEAQASLQYILFKKALKTKMYSGKSKDKHQEQANINNLITSDMSEVLFFYWSTHATWINIVMITVILLMIYNKLKDAIVNGLYVFVGAFFYNIAVSTLIQKIQRKMFSQKDKRVSISSDVIEGMKSIKYLCWEGIFEQKINQIRSQEFKYLHGVRGFDGVLAIFWNSISYFLLFAFLVTFINKGHQLIDSNVFTIIALFNFLTYPLGILPWAISSLLRVRVSINRINKFFQEREIEDPLENQRQYYQNYHSASESFANNQTSDEEPQTNMQIQQDNDKKYSVEIHNMEFTWPVPGLINDDKNSSSNVKKSQKKSDDKKDEPDFILNIQELKIESKKLTFIIGRIGSGKSALCQSIVNEMDVVNELTSNNKGNLDQQQSSSYSLRHSSVFGPEDQKFDKFKLESFSENSKQQYGIKVAGSTAIVSQVHWLQNRSIKDNILFGKYYDKNFYNKCIKMCQLEQDLKTFIKGDLKIIGPGGTKLSGGQRQRVALCRAIYQDCDIYILDDVFSSLDAHVADAIFQDVILDHLIKNGKSIIFVTSHYRYLKQYDSNIVFLENGQIIHDQDRINEYINEKLQQETKELQEMQKQRQLEIIENMELDDKLNNSPNKFSQESINQNDQDKINENNNILKLKKYKKEEFDQEQEEQREQGSVKQETLMTYVRAMTIYFLVSLLITNFMMQSSRTVIDFWLRSEITPGNTGFDFLNDIFNDDFAATFTFLIILNVVITLIRVIFYVICSQMAAYRMFYRLNKCIIYSNMKFFDQNSNGRIINRLSSDAFIIDTQLPWLCHVFLENLAQSVGLSIGIVIQFPWMIIFIILAGIMIYLVQKLFRVSNRELRRLNSVNEGIVLTHIGEVCKGLITIRTFQKQEIIINEYLKKMTDNITSWVMSQNVLSWMQIRLWLVSNIILAFVGITCIFLLIFQENFEYSTVAMTLTYSLLLTDCFSQLVMFLSGAEQQLISVERQRQYYNNEQEDILAIPNEQKLQQDQLPLQKQDLETYSIIFNNVSLTYDNFDSNQNSHNIANQLQSYQLSLNNINLQIRKGEKVAFCGRTGSGKTSILNCLFKMYPLCQGNIYVNGQSIYKVSLQQLRSQISVIPQFGFLYGASMKENLDPDNSFQKEQVQQIINSSGLQIRRQKKGKEENKEKDQNQQEINITADADFEIEKSGGNLSSGEKQIINYLRIILLKREIICLDEATSNMDPQTDALLHEKLFEFSQGKTLLVITHRLENIEKFDRVIVLEKGEIVEQGHVSELRKLKGGFFNRLMRQN